jgi:hypothetical protein
VVEKDKDGDIWLATAALALVIIALALMIANMGYFQLGDEQSPLGPMSRQVAEVLSYVLLGVWICVGALVLVQMARKGKAPGRERKGGRSGGTVTALIAIFVILGCVLAFIYATGGAVVTPPSTPDGGGGGGGGSGAPLTADDPAGSLMLIGLLIFVALLAIVLGLKYVRRAPVRMGAAREAIERQKAKDIVDQAVRDLYAGDDARSVVVRTYQMMSRLLRGKVLDAEALTPREVAAMAESQLGWPKEPTNELTSLFEEAWYSDHQLREESKEAALRCLRQISTHVSGRQGAQRRGADAAGS